MNKIFPCLLHLLHVKGDGIEEIRYKIFLETFLWLEREHQVASHHNYFYRLIGRFEAGYFFKILLVSLGVKVVVSEILKVSFMVNWSSVFGGLWRWKSVISWWKSVFFKGGNLNRKVRFCLFVSAVRVGVEDGWGCLWLLRNSLRNLNFKWNLDEEKRLGCWKRRQWLVHF